MLMTRLPDGVKSCSFTLGISPLSVIEQTALDCIHKIAAEHREATQTEICEAIGYSGTATTTGVVNRLVSKGYIEHVSGRLQKAMWLRIVSTGEVTAEPRNKTIHWRYRKERVPTITIQRVAEYAKPLAQLIEAKARSLGKPLDQYLMDCIYVGHFEITHEERDAQTAER